MQRSTSCHISARSSSSRRRVFQGDFRKLSQRSEHVGYAGRRIAYAFAVTQRIVGSQVVRILNILQEVFLQGCISAPRVQQNLCPLWPIEVVEEEEDLYNHISCQPLSLSNSQIGDCLTFQQIDLNPFMQGLCPPFSFTAFLRSAMSDRSARVASHRGLVHGQYSTRQSVEVQLGLPCLCDGSHLNMPPGF